MSTSTSVTAVLDDGPMRKETIAVADVLAGCCGSTRTVKIVARAAST